MGPPVNLPADLRFEPWSDAQRRANLRETLAAAPDPEAIWVFGYGSLIWDPRFEPAETRLAVLPDHRRSFCFWITRARASLERPGLGLAVVPCEGSVAGLAHRIPRDERFDEVLEALWLREMLAGVYHAVWKTLRTDRGDVPAIVYVANESHRNFAGDLPLDDRARVIAGAKGERGWNYEYLGHLVRELERLGIDDAEQRALYERILAIVRSSG